MTYIVYTGCVEQALIQKLWLVVLLFFLRCSTESWYLTILENSLW